MLRVSRVWANYQRGSWSPGSKHQKHMMLNPSLFLYRFPGPRGPGPYTMKYWWTLGCFPTGLSTPFRLPEFLATYQQSHVPAEVEEWLGCFIQHPVEELQKSVHALRDKLEQLPEPEQTRGYTALGVSLTPCLPLLKKIEEQLGMAIPVLGLRSAMQTPTLRAQLLEDLYEYEEALTVCGSTPHRRMGVECVLPQGDVPQLNSTPGVKDSNDNGNANQSLPASSSTTSDTLAKPNAEATTSITPPEHTTGSSSQAVSLSPDANMNSTVVQPPTSHALQAALTLPATTARDERALLRLCTTIAEGCVAKARPDSAHALLSASLFLAQDDLTRSVVHGNTACAALLEGDFAEAAFHAREAALLPSNSNDNSDSERPVALRAKLERRSYALWATAVAYQDDMEAALNITRDALALFPQDETLMRLQSKLEALRVAAQGQSTPAAWRGKRLHTAVQRRRGLESGSGTAFDNEFDWIVFNNRHYPSKMDPRSNEMGSVFRRVGDLGGPISTSRSMEPL